MIIFFNLIKIKVAAKLYGLHNESFIIGAWCDLKGVKYIWSKGPELTDRPYLKDSNNAGYKHSNKSLDCKIDKFHSTNEMLEFCIFQESRSVC